MKRLVLSTALIWVLAAAVLAPGSLLSGSVATILLDAVVRGLAPASVTTMFPGYVYASATVMKVGLVCGLLSVVMAVIAWAKTRGLETHACVYGVASIVLAPASILVGAVVVAIGQVAAGSLTLTDASYVSRRAVVMELALIVLGAVAAVASLVRRERPRSLAALGLIVNVVLIGLFWRLRFYALGFDQDLWAPQ